MLKLKTTKTKFYLLLTILIFAFAYSLHTYLSSTTAHSLKLACDYDQNHKPQASHFSLPPSLADDEHVYRIKCQRLYKKLRSPNMSLYFWPPLKQPPAHLLDEFTQHGQMPIKLWTYINEAYVDSKGDLRRSEANDEEEKQRVIKSETIEKLRRRVRNDAPLNYEDRVLNKLMHQFKSCLTNKSLMVLGTQIPWIEAIGLEVGCSRVVTLDYTRYATREELYFKQKFPNKI
jgi:hypothetical protein